MSVTYCIGRDKAIGVATLTLVFRLGFKTCWKVTISTTTAVST